MKARSVGDTMRFAGKAYVWMKDEDGKFVAVSVAGINEVMAEIIEAEKQGVAFQIQELKRQGITEHTTTEEPT